MARKSPINYAITALFSVTARELVDHIAGFCAVKRLAWSPDVKIEMVKWPASVIDETMWSALNMQPDSALHSILASLLKPIKEHQLFDLSDWMRDLNGGQVPDYVKTHWSNNRIPKQLDDLVKKTLGVDTNIVTAPDVDQESDDEWLDHEPAPRKAVAAKRVGKVAKQDMRQLHSVDAMQRIAQAQEDLTNFLSKGYVVPQVKMDLYRDIAHRSFTAYGLKDITARKRTTKGVPTITVTYGLISHQPTLEALQQELKEVFKNKAHVNVDVADTEIVLRTRKVPEVEAPKVVRKKPVAKKAPARKAITVKARKSSAKKEQAQGLEQGAFQFPTSETHGKTNGNGQQQPQA